MGAEGGHKLYVDYHCEVHTLVPQSPLSLESLRKPCLFHSFRDAWWVGSEGLKVEFLGQVGRLLTGDENTQKTLSECPFPHLSGRRKMRKVPTSQTCHEEYVS